MLEKLWINFTYIRIVNANLNIKIKRSCHYIDFARNYFELARMWKYLCLRVMKFLNDEIALKFSKILINFSKANSIQSIFNMQSPNA